MSRESLHLSFLALQERLKGGALGVAACLIAAAGNDISETGFKSEQYFPMASCVKVPLAMCLMREVAGGRISLDETLDIHPNALCPGAPQNPLDRMYCWPFRSPRRATVRELLDFMLVYSDNTATDAVLGRLGGMDSVSRYLREQGIDQVHVERSMSELMGFYCGLQLAGNARGGTWARTREIAGNLGALVSAYRVRAMRDEHLARTTEDCATPAGMLGLLRILVTDPAYELIVTTMKGCRTGRRRIASVLDHYPVRAFAHKTGSLGSITEYPCLLGSYSVTLFGGGHRCLFPTLFPKTGSICLQILGTLSSGSVRGGRSRIIGGVSDSRADSIVDQLKALAIAEQIRVAEPIDALRGPNDGARSANRLPLESRQLVRSTMTRSTRKVGGFARSRT